MHDLKQQLKQQAHFAIHISTTEASILPKLQNVTDGRLLSVLQKFVYTTPDIDIKTLWNHIDKCFKSIRNYYAHTITDDNIYNAITKDDAHKQHYEYTKRFLQYAYNRIPDPKGQKKTLFTDTDITQDGIIFFACTVSTREMANRFIGGISGYKRTDPYGQDLRKITLHYAYRDGYNLIASGTQDNTQDWRKAMEILDYIRKPVQGTDKAEQAEKDRANKDEQDVHDGLYDIRTQKNLFPYFASTWLESQYMDNPTITLSFLRKNGNATTNYKPNGKDPKKRKTYVIDKFSDSENYNINLPLYTPYRGTAVVAVIKNKQDKKSVLLSDMDLFYMVLLQLEKRLPLQRIMNHDKRNPRTPKPVDFETRVKKRIELIKQRWRDCEHWTTREKINRIIWVFQNLIFKQKIEDTRIADMLRLEIINYQGRKAFKRFMSDNAIDSDYKFPPNNRLNEMLPERGNGYDSLLTAAKNCVLKWCDTVNTGETAPESEQTIHRILNIKPHQKATDTPKPMPFIDPKFWRDYFKQNIILEYLTQKNITGFNLPDFYSSNKDKESKSGKPCLPKSMFHVYLKDIILHRLAQQYLQQQTGNKQIELIGKKHCRIIYTPKKSKIPYEITIPLRHIGKSYVMDSIPKGTTQDTYLRTLFSYVAQNLKTNTPSMMGILTAKRELQKGMHDFCWRWLQCERILFKSKNAVPNEHGQMKIEETLNKRFGDYNRQAKIITWARNKCLHSNIWNMECSDTNKTVDAKTAFKTLSDLEKKLKIEK